MKKNLNASEIAIAKIFERIRNAKAFLPEMKTESERAVWRWFMDRQRTQLNAVHKTLEGNGAFEVKAVENPDQQQIATE